MLLRSGVAVLDSRERLHRSDAPIGKVEISPSPLSADLLNLGRELEAVKTADRIHINVVDGHFAPNLTFGPAIVEAAHRGSGLPVEVHLMVDNPEDVAEWFLNAGAELVIAHIEAARDPISMAARIHRRGGRVGMALSPQTPVCRIASCIAALDSVLMLGVSPGFAGQKMTEEMTGRLRELRELCRREGVSPDIEVDGGVAHSNAAQLVSCGATVLCVGTSVFGASEDRAGQIEGLRKAAGEGLSVKSID